MFRLFLVETSCLGQIQHLVNLSLFTSIVAVFSFFFCSFYSYKTFFVRVPILKDYPHTPQTFGMQTRQRWSLFPSRNNIFSLVFFDSFYLKLKIFLIRLVTSEKYKLSFFSQLSFLNVQVTGPPKKYYFFSFLVQNTSPSLYTNETCKSHFNNHSSKVTYCSSLSQLSRKLFYIF